MNAQTGGAAISQIHFALTRCAMDEATAGGCARAMQKLRGKNDLVANVVHLNLMS
jgi:hypothetical protein